MPEKLAIVTIDAGSNVTGNSPLFPERVGTSSGKGTLASAIREVGGLAYDSGRAYRTITAAAQAEGLEAGSVRFLESLIAWEKAGRFGHCDTGLSLDGEELQEHIVHGEAISKNVADFSPLAEVRNLTKRMKIKWIQEYAGELGVGLVGLDGRAMREFVEGEVLAKVEGCELITPFCMVVEVTEAARRRMAQRKDLVYDNPAWYVHPKLNRTVQELMDRARKDEERADDPVIIPKDHYTYAVKGDEGLRLSRLDEASLEDSIREKRTALIDTTDAGVNEVKRVGMVHILKSLEVLDGFDSEAAKLRTSLQV